MKLNKGHLMLILAVIPAFIFMTVDKDHNASRTKDFIGKTINFLVLFGGLGYVLYKPVKEYFRKRKQQIIQVLEDAEQEKRKSEKNFAEIKERLQSLTQEVNKIKSEARAKGIQEKELIIQAASREAERHKRMAAEEIERHSLTRLRRIKEYAAVLAVEVARERIEQRITAENQSALIDKCINRLDKLHEKTDSGKEIRPRSH